MKNQPFQGIPLGLHSVPSNKEQSYKERLVDFYVTKEQRLVD